jgi:hypothetical protein
MRHIIYWFGLWLSAAASAQTYPIHYNNKALQQLSPMLYADAAYPPEKHAQLISAMGHAKRRVADFFGEQLAADPDVIFCKKQDCAAYFAGTGMRGKALRQGQTASGGRYKTSRPTIVIVKQGRYGEQQLAHELNHIEVNARTGSKPMPAWFVEGLATYMAKQPECTPNDHVDAQGVDHLQQMSTQHIDWLSYTNDPLRSHVSYCQAAHEVSLWIKQRGKPALIKLLSAVKMGKKFEDEYGARLSQTQSR